VIRALVLAAILFTLVLPFAASAQGGVAVKGYVKGDCGDKGVMGAVVEIYNVQTGQLKGKSTTKSEFGDWIISLSGTAGNYRIVVTLPDDSGAQVVEWAYGAGDMQQTVAGPVDQVMWQLGPATPLTPSARYGILIYGPLTIFTDEPCTSPEANGPNYVYGKAAFAAPNPACVPPQVAQFPVGTPFPGQPVVLLRDRVGGTPILIAVKTTNAVGMFGFGITPVTGKWYVVVGGVTKEFKVSAGAGKGPMNLGTIGIPSPCV
jgi:hypothetical protein